MRHLTRIARHRRKKGRIAKYGSTALSVLVGGSLFLAAPAFAAAPETPTTEAASAITSTTAVLHGALNPGASGTAGYYFTYGRGENCEGVTTEPGAEATGKDIKVSAPITGLEGSSEYTFCVAATHLEGETTESALGLPLKFTTLASKPTTEGGEVSSLTPFSASVFTSVNPENEPTSCMFEYGETLTYGNSVPCEPSSLEGPEPQTVTGTFTGLTPATAYHYRVAVTNTTGKTEGTAGTFTTLALEAPIVDGESTSKVTAGGAELEAQINPNYQETSYIFEYATNEALAGAATAAGASSLPPEFGDQPASVAISGLQPRTTYYYRVVATNGAGNKEGPVQSFTTLAVPIVTTGAAQQITRTTAQASGTVNPGGTATVEHIAYIDQESYEAAVKAGAENPYAGGHVTPNVEVGSDFSAHDIETTQFGELTPGTTYHFAVVAANAVGTTIGPDMTFTSLAPTPPLAVTGEPVGITPTSATLTGAVDTRGLQTEVSFEFGSTPALGSLEQASVIAGSESGTTVAISTAFGSYLQPGTTYYYRAVASNPDGTSQGTLKSFTTSSFPALPTIGSQPLLALPPAAPPTKTSGTTPTKKRLTTAQKLAKALKACDKKPKSKQAACQKQAHKKYRVKKKTKKAKK
jgi:hypothetical protein